MTVNLVRADDDGTNPDFAANILGIIDKECDMSAYEVKVHELNSSH